MSAPDTAQHTDWNKQTPQKSFRQKVAGQYLHSLISRAIMLVIKAFLAFFLVHQLKQSAYGFYGVIASSLGIWIAMSDLGWGDYLRREAPALTEPLRKESLKTSSTVQLIWMSLLLIGAAIIWSSGAIPFFYDLSLTPLMLTSSVLLFFIGGLFPILLIYLNFSKSIEEFNHISLLQMASWLALLVGHYLSVGAVSLEWVVASWTLSYLVSFIYFSLKKKTFMFGKMDFSYLKKSLNYGLPLTFTDVSKKVLQYYDRYLLGSFVSLSKVAPYHFFNSLFDLSEKVNQITLFPYIFQAHDESHLSRRNRLITTLVKSRILLQALGIGSATLVLVFFPKVLPQSYSNEWYLFLLIGATSLVRIFGIVPFLALLLEKKTSVVAVSNVIGLVVSVPFNLWLIPQYHAYGAATALFVSTLSTVIFQSFFFDVRHYFDLSHFFSLKVEKGLLKDWIAQAIPMNNDKEETELRLFR